MAATPKDREYVSEHDLARNHKVIIRSAKPYLKFTSQENSNFSFRCSFT